MYDFGIRQAYTGYRPTYRAGENNFCPGCGQSHWIIGRLSAECAFCSTAIPLIQTSPQGHGLFTSKGVKPAPIAA